MEPGQGFLKRSRGQVFGRRDITHSVKYVFINSWHVLLIERGESSAFQLKGAACNTTDALRITHYRRPFPDDNSANRVYHKLGAISRGNPIQKAVFYSIVA